MFIPILDGPGTLFPNTNPDIIDPYGQQLKKDYVCSKDYYYMYPKDPQLDTYKIATWEDACKIGNIDVPTGRNKDLCILKKELQYAKCKVNPDATTTYTDTQCVKVYDIIHIDACKVFFNFKSGNNLIGIPNPITNASAPKHTSLKSGNVRVGDYVVINCTSNNTNTVDKNYVWGKIGSCVPLYYDLISDLADFLTEGDNKRTFFPIMEVTAVYDSTVTDKVTVNYLDYFENGINKTTLQYTKGVCQRYLTRKFYKYDESNNVYYYYDHEGNGWVPLSCNENDKSHLIRFDVEISFNFCKTNICIPAYQICKIVYNSLNKSLIDLSPQTKYIKDFVYLKTAKENNELGWYFITDLPRKPQVICDSAFKETKATYIDFRTKQGTTDTDHQVTNEDTIITLGKYMCKNSLDLQHVYLPIGVSEIPEECFYGCKFLKRLQQDKDKEGNYTAEYILQQDANRNIINPQTRNAQIRTIGSKAFTNVGTNAILNLLVVYKLEKSALQQSSFVAVQADSLQDTKKGYGMNDLCCADMHNLRIFSKKPLTSTNYSNRALIEIPDKIAYIPTGCFLNSTICYDLLYGWKHHYQNKYGDLQLENPTCTGVDVYIPYLHRLTIGTNAFWFNKDLQSKGMEIIVEYGTFDWDTKKWYPCTESDLWPTVVAESEHHTVHYSGSSLEFIRNTTFGANWMNRFWDFYQYEDQYCTNVIANANGPITTNEMYAYDLFSSYPYYQLKQGDDIRALVIRDYSHELKVAVNDYTFLNCASLKSLTISSQSNINIGHSAFEACINLSEINQANGGDLSVLTTCSFKYCVKLNPDQFTKFHVKHIDSYALYEIGGQNSDGSYGYETDTAVFNSVQYLGLHALRIYCGKHRCHDAVIRFKSPCVAGNFSMSLLPWNRTHRKLNHAGAGWIYLEYDQPDNNSIPIPTLPENATASTAIGNESVTKFMHLFPFAITNDLYRQHANDYFKYGNWYVYIESGNRIPGLKKSGNCLQWETTTFCVPRDNKKAYYKNWKFLDAINGAYAKSYK